MNLTSITICFLSFHLILQLAASPAAKSNPQNTLSPPTPNLHQPQSSADSIFFKFIKRHLSSQAHPQRQKNHHHVYSRATVDSDIQNNSLSSGAGTIDHAHEELFKVVPEVRNVYLAIALIPAFIVIFGSFSAFVKEKLYIGEAIISVVFGIILGPYVSGVFDPRSWSQGRDFDQLTLEITRIVVALSVFAVGVELPKAYILRHWRSLALLIGPGMLFGWIISGALIYALVPALSFLQALVIAAAVTPTDPVLASSVVGRGKYAQKHVPAHLRHLLQAESGCNDGAAFPFLYMAMFLLLKEDKSVGFVVGRWILLILLYQIVLGIAMGTIVGILARKTLKFCKRRSMIDKESMVAMYVALALLTTGVTALAGSDDLLAAFACGAAFAWDDWFTESIEASNFSSILDLLINCATFIYIGATIPFSSWNDATLTLVPWRLVVLGFSILVLRRLPVLILMQKIVPDFKTHREAVFCGHFGPIGVGAIFISTLATTKLPTPQVPPQTSLDVLALTTQSLIYLLVLFSILIHGLSIPFFTLGRNVHSRVHTMTRTWTQASGNEPSWLSRVKRVEKSTDNNADAIENEGNNPIDSTPVDSQNPTIPMEESQRQISDDQITQVECQNQKDPIPVPSAPIHSQIPRPIANDRERPKVITQSTLLRLGSRTKKTPEELEAHRREKMMRDAWCRPERVDVVKKDEERVYKSGRRLVIERGDGEEVEVHDLPRVSPDKSPRATSDSAAIPVPGLTGSPNLQSPSSGMRKFDFAKLIAPRSLNRLKTSQVQDYDGMPLPGQGPRSQSFTGHPLNPNPILPSSESQPQLVSSAQPVSGIDEAVWIEGDKVVVETNDGEYVRVEPCDKEELRSSRSLPAITRPPSFDSSRGLSKPSLPDPTSAVNPQDTDESQPDSKLSRPIQSGSKSNEDGEDEWEEENDSSALDEEGQGRMNFHDNHVDRNRSSTSQRRHSRQSRRPRRKMSGRLSGGPSAPGNPIFESSHPRKSADFAAGLNPPSHGVQFVSPEKQKSRLPRTRSPSPRSIRFAKYPERPMKPSQLKHHKSMAKSHRKSDSKSRLKDFVAPAVDSWRRSSLTGAGTSTPNSILESSRTSYFSGTPADQPPRSTDSPSDLDDLRDHSRKD